MRKPWYKAALALVAVAALALGGSAIAEAEPAKEAATGTPADHEAFDRILKAQSDAWFAEDGAAFAATFWHDADLVTFNGDHLQTREGIATRMQYYFDNFMDPTHIKTLDEDVTFVGPNLAVIVRTSCLLVEEDAGCREGSMSTNTNVVVKKWGRWLQQSFQNTRKAELG